MIRILPFERWREIKLLEPLPDSPNAMMVKCGECDGYGEIEDEGIRTGKCFDVECPTCDGTGEVEAKDQVKAKKAKLTKVEYEQEVRMDLSMLAAWTGKPYWEILLDAGFEVSFDIKSKMLSAKLP